MMQDVHVKLNPGLPWPEQHSTRRRLFSPANCYIWSIALCGAETWTLRKVDQKYPKVLKGGAGEGLRGSIGTIVWETIKCYEESRRRGISYIQYKEGRPTGLVTSCVGAAF